jgi:hypothetical protein
MVSIAPTKAVQDVQPAQSAHKSADDEPRRESEQRATEIYPQLTPDAVSVQFDEASQRFVQVATDPVTNEVVMTYPSESQLAYSRAIMAYLRTLASR